jgi:hypothetical protein
MKRRLFNLVAAVSLVLGAASVLLWIRSVQWGDVTGWNHGQRHGFLKSDEAALWLCWNGCPPTVSIVTSRASVAASITKTIFTAQHRC